MIKRTNVIAQRTGSKQGGDRRKESSSVSAQNNNKKVIMQLMHNSKTPLQRNAKYQ